MTDAEVWLPLPGYPKNEISSHGRLRKFTRREPQGYFRGQWLETGYWRIGIRKGGPTKYFFVHRLVLETFVGLCPPDMEAAHLDGDRNNNHLSNLAWVTRKENQFHRRAHGTHLGGEKTPAAKLTWAAVDEIRRLKGIARTAELADRFGVGVAQIQRIQAGKAWAEENRV